MEGETSFEGIEKRLVIEFAPSRTTLNLLSLTTADWEPVLTAAQCEVLSYCKLGDRLVYLLSESTLTVWKSGFLLKTCGKTSPLLGLSQFLRQFEVSTDSVAWLAYTRLDFLHPQCQPWPHQSFSQEVSFVQNFYPSAQATSTPVGTQHFHMIFHCNTFVPRTQVFEEALMLGIYEHCTKELTGFENGVEQKQSDDGQASHGVLRSRFHKADAVLDEFWFSPQGYSCNALTKSEYFSCHVSPEPNTSYASLEMGFQDPIMEGSHSQSFSLQDFIPPFQAQHIHWARLCVAPKTRQHEPQASDVDLISDATGMCCRISLRLEGAKVKPGDSTANGSTALT